MQDKKETRGKKTNESKGLEVKKSYGVYLYPSQKEEADKLFGNPSQAVIFAINAKKKKR